MKRKILSLQSVSILTLPILTRHDEAVFQALMGIDWTTVDFQPLGRETEAEAVRDDPQPSGRAGDQA